LNISSLFSFVDLASADREKEQIRAAIQTLEFTKNTRVIEQGEVCRDIYFIRSGLIKMSYLTLEGKEFIKSFIQEGGFFGSLHSQLTGGGSTFSVVALESLTVERMPYSVLEELLENNPHLQFHFMRFFQQLALKKELREYELLCLSAQQRYAKLCEEQAGLVQRVKQAELALYLGITPIALSRLKHRKE